MTEKISSKSNKTGAEKNCVLKYDNPRQNKCIVK